MTRASRAFASKESIASVGQTDEKPKSSRGEEISDPVRPKEQLASTRVTRASRAFATKESEDKSSAAQSETQSIQPPARASLGSSGSSDSELGPPTRQSRTTAKILRPVVVPTIVVSGASSKTEAARASTKLPASAASEVDIDVDVHDEPKLSRKRSVSEDKALAKKMIRQSPSPKRQATDVSTPPPQKISKFTSDSRLLSAKPKHFMMSEAAKHPSSGNLHLRAGFSGGPSSGSSASSHFKHRFVDFLLRDLQPCTKKLYGGICIS